MCVILKRRRAALFCRCLYFLPLFGRRELCVLFTAETILQDLYSARRKKVLFDSDTFNEIDDQYALVHLLASPDRCEILGLCAAPFLNDRSVSPADGERKSYGEIVKVMSLTDEHFDYPVFHGSESFLSDRNTPVASPAVDQIIRAAAENPGEPIYVVAIGAVTNVASALLKAPEIRENLVVIWLGANLPEAGRNIDEFNLREDIPAGQALFDSGALILLLPMAVTANVYIAQSEMKPFLQRTPLPVCGYLYEEWTRYMSEEAHGKVVWDLAGSGVMTVPEAFSFETVPTPGLGDDAEYICRETDSKMLLLRQIDGGKIFADWFSRVHVLAEKGTDKSCFR